MKSKNYSHRFILVWAILFLISEYVYAQQTNGIERNKKLIDSVLKSEYLIQLNGYPKTSYSAGFETRAKTLQTLIKNCADFYENIFPQKHFSVNLFILNKTDWEKPRFQFPYGIPFYDPDYDIMLIAAEKNALAKITGLKEIPETPDSILTGLDYQPLHELGHYFFFTLNHINIEKWFNEFLATYFLICYIKAKNLAPEIEKMMSTDYPVEHRSLDDFQKLYVGVGPKNYHWYQSRFAQLGFALYPQFKTTLIKMVLDNYGLGAKNADGITLLKNIAPQTMDSWLKEMQ